MSDLLEAALRALRVQETAELEHSNCPDCEGLDDWAKCGRCSEFFGTAIELRREVLTAALSLPDVGGEPRGEAVAWRWRWGRMGSNLAWHLSVEKPTFPEEGYEIEPLYATPPAQPAREVAVTELLRAIVATTHRPNPQDQSRIDVAPGQHRAFQDAIEAATAALASPPTGRARVKGNDNA